jgi:hypothetical protein
MTVHGRHALLCPAFRARGALKAGQSSGKRE